MNKSLILILLVSSLSIFCSKKTPEVVLKKDSVELMKIKNDTAVTVTKEFTTGTGKKFVIVETKPAISVSNYMITGVGFRNSEDTIKYYQKNPMTTAFLTDLDNNGFDEIYIVTKASGPGIFLDILGITSFEDNTFGEIVIPRTTNEDMKKDENFNGYLGNDSIYIRDNKIVRLFPVYKSSDYNSLPTGIIRKLTYTLNRNDSNYELLITGVENIK